MALWEGYSDCWEDFVNRMNHVSSLLAHLKEHGNDLGLDTVKYLLSVGPGTGELDQSLVMQCLPTILRYTAIEPDSDILDTLKAKMSTLNLKKDFVHDTLQRYTGPSDPVDLILMCHVAYYFADTLEDQIRRGLSWLGDNGKMLIVHDQNSIHKLVATALPVDWGDSSLITVEDLRRRLAPMNLNCREVEINYTLDLSNPGKGYYDFVSILTNRKSSREEVDKVLALMKTVLIPGTQHVKSTQSMFIISK